MDVSAVALCLTLLLSGTSCTAGVQVVDLTHNFGPKTLYWPGSPSFSFDILSRGNNTAAGFWYESNSFFTAEHGGTHMDAPAHFFEGRWRVQDIPASHLAGPAVVVDVKAKALANADYLLTIKDLEDWERLHGKMPPKSIVFMNSGWAARYPNPFQVFNTQQPTNASTFHFPGIHPDTASFLATRRNVFAVGVDTPSLDYGRSTTFTSHVNLFRYNVYGLENVAGLDLLPAKGSTVVVGMIKLVDGSGGPVRILGLVGEGADIFGTAGTGSGHRPALSEVLQAFCLVLMVVII